MKNLIIYASQHGCTESCARKLKEQLPGEVELLSLKSAGNVRPDDFDTILIGGSIHAGRIQKRIKTFCRDHRETLLSKTVGLFLCCMEEGETARKQFEDAYPEELRTHAKAQGLFGGAFNFERMNFLERKIIKKIAKVEGSVSRISQEAIDSFVAELTA